jgi:hypothetical protein
MTTVSSVEVVISIVSIENRICKQTRLALLYIERRDALFASSGSEGGYSVTYPIIVTLGPVTLLNRDRDGIYCDFRE